MIKLKIPNRVSLSVNVVFHFYPKGEYHVDDNGRANGHATGVDEKKTDIFNRHPQLFAKFFANPESVRFNQKFERVLLNHILKLLFSKITKNEIICQNAYSTKYWCYRCLLNLY
ncbi:MAG: hypothetical protein JWO06_25, partial [Bacteroidota bacterium]|nr:hypothetical protein [Bacteroidota bacterium]